MRGRTVLVASLALAAASLLLLRQTAFDPTAWLIWGRELSGGTLSVIGGPSWKPLPVVFTTVFSGAGDTAAPLLWLLVARMSGLLAVAVIFGLTRRLGGVRAGVVAALALVLAKEFLYNCLRGDSEGLLVLSALGAIDLHLVGRRHLALGAAFCAALLRPEVWPLLALYALWLVHDQRRARTGALVAACAVAVLAAWFAPDYIVTGDWLRGVSRALHPVPGSPAQSSFPFGLTFVHAAAFLAWPVYAGAVYATLRAYRRDERERDRERDRVVLGLAGASTLLMLMVALLSQTGFTGNIRYVTLPGALLCVLGGLGLPPLVAALRVRARPALVWAAAGAAAIGVLVSAGILVSGAVRLARDEHALGAQLDRAIALAGGKAGLQACGSVAATPFERQAVAYRLGLRSLDVSTHAVTPGTMLVRIGRPAPGALTLPVRARSAGWTVRSTCGARG